MAKNKTNNTKDIKKTVSKTKNATTNVPVVEEQVIDTTAETVEAVPVEEMKKNLVSRNNSQLSADGQVQLLGLAAKFFKDDPDAESKYGKKVVDNMNRITAVGIVIAIADQAVNGDSAIGYALRTSPTAYKMLSDVANEMGVKIPNMKSLPAPNENGEVVIPSDKIKVSEETKKALKEENKLEKEGLEGKIELDPTKVAHMSEDDLRKALKYILITNFKHDRNVKESLVKAVDFMHDYRIELARQAENSTEAMNKIEDRNMRDWLSDIFSYVEPTVYIKGIGEGMYTLCKNEKAPLSAFLIFRDYLTNKKTGKPEWDDQSIADAVFSIVELMCKNNIAKETKAKELLDSKAKDYSDIVAKYDDAIKTNKEILENITNVKFEILDTMIPNKDNMTKASAYSRIWKQYYPECDAAHVPGYRNLMENIVQQGGIILNLFRSAGNKNQNYDPSNLSKIETYTMEEYEEIQKKIEEEKKSAKKDALKKD